MQAGKDHSVAGLSCTKELPVGHVLDHRRLWELGLLPINNKSIVSTFTLLIPRHFSCPPNAAVSGSTLRILLYCLDSQTIN